MEKTTRADEHVNHHTDCDDDTVGEERGERRKAKPSQRQRRRMCENRINNDNARCTDDEPNDEQESTHWELAMTGNDESKRRILRKACGNMEGNAEALDRKIELVHDPTKGASTPLEGGHRWNRKERCDNERPSD